MYLWIENAIKITNNSSIKVIEKEEKNNFLNAQ